MNVPPHIVEACNALLAPYGVKFDPNRDAEGYLSMKDAAKYLGISKPMLYKLVKAGRIERIKLGEGVQGKAVVPRRSLDAYVSSKRA